MITFQQYIVMDTLFVIVTHLIFASSDVSHEGSYVMAFITIAPNKF